MLLETLGSTLGALIRAGKRDSAADWLRCAMVTVLSNAYANDDPESAVTDDWEDELDSWPERLIERLAEELKQRSNPE